MARAKLYRVLRTCTIGDKVIKPKETPVIRLTLSPKTERIALDVSRCLAIVQGPSIGAIRGWENRGRDLKKIGIENVTDLLVADVGEVATKLGKTEKTIKRWQKELNRLIIN